MEKPSAMYLKLNRLLSVVCHKWMVAAVVSAGLSFFQQQARAQQSKHADTVAVTAATLGSVAETSPEPYGGLRSFYHFLGRRLTFDNTGARQKATVAFMVEKDGTLTHVRIVKSTMSKEMDAQIIRAVYLAPRWTPGTQNGQPIRVAYTFPVTNY